MSKTILVPIEDFFPSTEIEYSMNKYEKAFKKYREFVEGMSGWETVYAGYGYETFVFMCKRSKTFRERWITDEIIVKYLEKHIMVWT